MNSVENQKKHFATSHCSLAAAASTLIVGVTVVAISALMLYALNNPSSNLKCLVCRLGDQANTLSSTLLVAGLTVTTLGLTLLLTDPCFEDKKSFKKDKVKNNLYNPTPKVNSIEELRPFFLKMKEDLEITNNGLLNPKKPLAFSLLQEDELKQAGWMLGYYENTKEAHINLFNEVETFLVITKERAGVLNKTEQELVEKIKSTQQEAVASMNEWVLIEGHLKFGTSPKEILKVIRQNKPI